MSFLFYFAVLVVAAASAVFGLDLMTAPLPQDKPAQMASTAAPSKLEQREADRKEEAAKQASTDDRALSPVFPAAPGGGNKDVRMVYPPTNVTTAKAGETTGAAQGEDEAAKSRPAEQAVAQPQPAQPAEPREQPQQATQPPAAEPPVATAKAEAETKAEPAATQPAASAPVSQPVVQQSAGHCDVSACAAAYRSFRASDCTYQPFDGPRRVCEKPPQGEQQRSAERAQPQAVDPRLERAAREARQARKDAELNAVAKRVRQMTGGGDDEYPLDEPPLRGRRIIVIQRGFADDD